MEQGRAAGHEGLRERGNAMYLTGSSSPSVVRSSIAEAAPIRYLEFAC
jgi:hypothetical protein